jgi:hypothetical protein
MDSQRDASVKTAILIPTYGRPHRVEPLTRSIRDNTKIPYSIYFIVEEHDQATIEAANRVGARMIINQGEPTYASCINTAYTATTERFFLLGADDIELTPGCLAEAVSCMSDSRIGVVGVRDPLHPFVDHSTHSLVRRRYIEEYSGCLDMPNTVLYPYKHAWTDWEMVSVAKVRGAYYYCDHALVEHHHPGWHPGGVVRSDSERFDATYAKGNESVIEDFAVFSRRARRWVNLLRKRKPLTRADRKIIGRVMEREYPIRAKIRSRLQFIRKTVLQAGARARKQVLRAP